MGRATSSSANLLAYGIAIEQPKNPNWYIMARRLKNFKYDDSLFARASRAASADDLKEDETPLAEPIAKAARIAHSGTSILISKHDTDALTEEEKELDEPDFEDRDPANLFYEEDVLANPLNEIFGGSKDHGLVLEVHNGTSGFEWEDGKFLAPVVFLRYDDNSQSTEVIYPGADVFEIQCPEVPNKAKVDADMAKVLSAFGLKAKSGPGWHLVSTSSCDPH